MPTKHKPPTKSKPSSIVAGLPDNVVALAVEKLAESGLDLKDAAQSDIEIWAPGKTLNAGFWKHDGRISSLWLPYRDPWSGKLVEVNGEPFGRCRRLVEPAILKNSKGEIVEQPRYLQRAKSGCHVYFPTSVDWRKVRLDTSIAMNFCEGEIKSIKAVKEGFTTIGLAGVNSFAAGGELLPELAAMAWKGRRVTITFDADVASKTVSQVTRARQELANLLIDQGARLFCVDLPVEGSKTGLDDYLVKHGATAYRVLLKEAKEMIKVSANLTEDGLALAFRDRYLETVRFDHHAGRWLMWSGVAWRRDETDKAFNLIRGLCRETSQKLGLAGADKARLGRNSTFKAVDMIARSDPALATTSDLWDADPFLLGTPGGTVDLRTGELMLANADDHISRLTAVAPADTADCPQWLKFLDDVTNHDKTVIRFLQQWSGYCLTGDARHHELVFVFGNGRNGKNVLLNTVSHIMAEYHKLAAMETFMASYGTKHSTDLAMLASARLVTASETEEGRTWNEQLIKSMTGDADYTARFMHKDNVTFKRVFKLFIIGNHKPALKTIDLAIRSRFNLVPFTRVFEKPDLRLEEKLRSEWRGILRWLINGCLDWQKHGLTKPQVVLDATQDYFEVQDAFAAWMSDCCARGETKSFQGRPADFLNNFNRWAEANKVRQASRVRFREMVERTPGLRYKAVNGADFIAGLRLLTAQELNGRLSKF